MTVVVSWTRKTKSGRELWIMSDSRLSGGKCWDYGPKIFSMGRSDAIIAFAGDTAWSYPLIAQVTSYVDAFVNLRERKIDYVDAEKKIISMLNESIKFVSDAVDKSLEEPGCAFIFCGYSARKQKFLLNRIFFDSKKKKFVVKSPKKINDELLAAIGDEGPLKEIYRIVSERENSKEIRNFKLGMLPSEAFFQVLSSGHFREIGGSPQIMRLCQNMTQQHIAVYWPPNVSHEEQGIYLRGRKLGRYEALDNSWVFDTSASRLYWHDFSPIEMQSKAKLERKTEQQAIVPLLNVI